MFDPVTCLLLCDFICIRYVEESSVEAHLHCFNSAMKIDGECPGFVWIQEDRYHETTHQAGESLILG